MTSQEPFTVHDNGSFRGLKTCVIIALGVVKGKMSEEIELEIHYPQFIRLQIDHACVRDNGLKKK